MTEKEIEALDTIQQREIKELQDAAEAAELYFIEDIYPDEDEIFADTEYENDIWWENHQWMLDNGLADECQEDEPDYMYNPLTGEIEEVENK